MKVLWFSNSPAAAYSNTLKGTGGWMVALDRAIQQEVELHVAYMYPYKQAAFMNGATWYHPIYAGNIYVKILTNRFSLNINKDYTELYLQLIDEVKPDVIHIHGTENTFHNIVGKTEVPIVVSIQGNPTVYAHKFFSGFHGKYIHKHKGELNLKSLILGRPSFADDLKSLQWLSSLEKINLQQIKYIIGRTDWDYRISRVLAPNSQYFVGNEILRDSFYQNLWDNFYKGGKLILHTTNGDNYYKGFETLCYALYLLNKTGLDVEWRVAGISKDSTINKITKKVLGSEYPDRGLVLMGSLTEEALVSSLKSSHIYVMPSHIENSPNSLCEAMLLGMPCIATMAGGTSSMLKDKEEGIIVQDGDPWGLAGAVIELKGNRQESLEYGRKARQHALARHDAKLIVNNLIETYKTIIGKSKH